MIRVERYAADQQPAWDEFVASSVNGTFLFCRDYMDYHADRFTDYSLMVYDDDRLIALLPANRSGETLVSHGGLTYGGFVIDGRMKTPLMLRVFDAALTFCRDQGFDRHCAIRRSRRFISASRRKPTSTPCCCAARRSRIAAS